MMCKAFVQLIDARRVDFGVEAVVHGINVRRPVILHSRDDLLDYSSVDFEVGD